MLAIRVLHRLVHKPGKAEALRPLRNGDDVMLFQVFYGSEIGLGRRICAAVVDHQNGVVFIGRLFNRLYAVFNKMVLIIGRYDDCY
ncbi:hypothetical protein D3C80_1932040 [compost metagenome]